MKLTSYCLMIAVCFSLALGCKRQSSTSSASQACASAQDSSQTFNFTHITYTSAVTPDQVNTLGRYLLTSQFADGAERAVRLDKRGDAYLFQVVVKNQSLEKTAQHSLFKSLAAELSRQVFDGAQVDIHLCDQHFRALALAPMYDFGQEKMFKNLQLFYRPKTPMKLVDDLGSYLMRSGLADGDPVSVHLAQQGKGYLVKIVVKSSADQEKNTPIFSAIPDLLAQAVFKRGRVEFQICDAEFNTIKSFKSAR